MTSLFNLDDLTEKQAKIFFVGFFIVLGLIGNLEAEDQRQDFERYKTLVCEGHVPDYKEIKPECL
ncbi:hypothetical protein HN803_07145 [candidate division WWE3 bacterium]|jgi:hypothetical protein|nr:hypothetical protein [candidate division WWE3 bacterium]